MKKIISKLLPGVALLLVSIAHAQNDKDAKFLPAANASPMAFAESSGVKAVYTLGTINGNNAFAISFENTNDKTATVCWNMSLTGKGVFYPGKPFKLRPGQTLDLNNNTNPNLRLAFIMKKGFGIELYKMKLRAVVGAPIRVHSDKE